MNEWKQAALSICIAAVMVGVCRVLLPEGNMKKAAVWVTGLFFLFTAVSSVFGVVGNTDLIIPELEPLQPSTVLMEENRQLMEQAAVDEAVQIAKTVADQEKLKITVLSVRPEIERGQIGIRKISVLIEGSREDSTRYREALERYLQGEIQVEWTKET